MISNWIKARADCHMKGLFQELDAVLACNAQQFNYGAQPRHFWECRRCCTVAEALKFDGQFGVIRTK